MDAARTVALLAEACLWMLDVAELVVLDDTVLDVLVASKDGALKPTEMLT